MTNQAETAVERYHARPSGFIKKFKAPPTARVEYAEEGKPYPRFVRFADGSSARVDADGDVVVC